MEDCSLANRAYRGVWNFENKTHTDQKSSSDHHHHHQKQHIVRVRAPDYLHHHHHHHHHRHLRPSNKSKSCGYSYKKSPSWISDPEMKRQKRIVKYKAYSVEGKMKTSFRNGFRWVKNKCCQLVHGY